MIYFCDNQRVFVFSGLVVCLFVFVFMSCLFGFCLFVLFFNIIF